MERKSNIDLFGAVALSSFSLLLAVNQVVIKLANGGFSPVFLAGARSVLAVGVIFLWMRWRGIPLGLPPGALKWGVVLGALFGAEFICLFIALDMTSVSRASVLFYTMPVWLSLGAHVLIPGDQIGRNKALGLTLAVAGVVLALSDRQGGEASLAGDALAILASFGWAAIALVVKTTPIGQTRPETQLFWQLLVSAPILMGAALFFGPFFRDPSMWHYAGLAFQVLAVASFGFLTWFWLLSIYPASGVASFSFLSPVFSVLLGWLLLGEQIGAVIWIALALVSAGIVLINKPR